MSSLLLLLLSVHITVLDPGHFHAALVQKSALEGVCDTVSVYAPAGPELDSYLASIEAYNNREENPTHWVENIYAGDDFLRRLPAGKGGVLVLAGNNRNKSRYILEGVKKGYNVLSDKPLAIDARGFRLLKRAYRIAARKHLVILDLMTERYDNLNIAARELIANPELFGEPVSASLTSIHHFCKMVSGKPTRRPTWYYDVRQQGEGIADVTTHLIDILFWQCFQDEAIKPCEVKVLEATHYPTHITPEQFALSTGGNIEAPLEVNSNGMIKFRARKMDVDINVRWDFVAEPGSGDTYQAEIVGTRGSLIFKQDSTTSFRRELYYRAALSDELVWIEVPQRTGHEEHFNLVAKSFLGYIAGKPMPEWEVPNTVSKYYITTTAVRKASKK